MGSKYYSLQYKYVSDIMEKRGPHREAHLGAAHKQVHMHTLYLHMAAKHPVLSAPPPLAS